MPFAHRIGFIAKVDDKGPLLPNTDVEKTFRPSRVSKFPKLSHSVPAKVAPCALVPTFEVLPLPVSSDLQAQSSKLPQTDSLHCQGGARQSGSKVLLN